MANELSVGFVTGKTIYFLIFNSTNRVWNGTSFVAPVSAGWTGYAIAATEQDITGVYEATMPATITAGAYSIFALLQAGGSPATTDAKLGSEIFYWSGTAEMALNSVALSSAGLDSIVVESGINMRQAMSGVMSALIGTLSGIGTSQLTFKDPSGSTTRITANIDQIGDRISITLSLPA